MTREIFVDTIIVKITYDQAKNSRNIVERGLSFDVVPDLEWNEALIIEDCRQDYGERRFRVFGPIGERLYAVVVTFRGDAVQVISFRKANAREVKRYGDQKKE